MAASTGRGILRVLEKLEVSVNSGHYYEAHQMYRTLYFRFLAQKKYGDLLKLLFKGSTLLLQHDQQGSGTDLALLLVDVLTKSDTLPCEEWIINLASLFEIMSSTIPERDAFLTNAVKWSMDTAKKGHPLLHTLVAEIFWKEKKYTEAHRHFLHSSDGTAYAKMLVELHIKKGLKSEVDLFIAQAVLQFLCLSNVQMATETFQKYTVTHPTIKDDQEPPNTIFPLLNFIWFLLKAIEDQKIQQFRILRNWYAISIERDPNYSIYLDNIGRIWFGIELPKDKKNNNMFGGLLKSIIGEVESSDDESDLASGRGSAPDLD